MTTLLTILKPGGLMRITYFFRHAENRANITKEFTCRRVDYPLTQKGWQIHNQVLSAWRNGHWETSFPGGENDLEVRVRLRHFFQHVLEPFRQGCIFVIGHGGLFNLLVLEYFPAGDPGCQQRKPIHNCAISKIHWAPSARPDQGHLVRWAKTNHLYGAAANLVRGTPD